MIEKIHYLEFYDAISQYSIHELSEQFHILHASVATQIASKLWTYDTYKSLLIDKSIDGYVLIIDKIISGFIIGNCLNGFDIFFIVIDPQYQNKNFGSTLITYIKKKYSLIYADVNANNQKLIHFYEKQQFKHISIRKNYYGHLKDSHLMIYSI